MTKITFIEPDGHRHVVDADAGISAMEAAIRNSVPGIPATCGGVCACATCHVYVDVSWVGRLAPMTDDENELLEIADNREANSRLSCQIRLSDDLDGIVLHLPDE